MSSPSAAYDDLVQAHAYAQQHRINILGTTHYSSEKYALMAMTGYFAQLGLHAKPCGLINVEGYFDLLLSFLDNAVLRGFMKQEHREMLLVSGEPASLLNQMASYRAPALEKWVGVRTRT